MIGLFWRILQREIQLKEIFAISCIGTTTFNWIICRSGRFCSIWKNVENITVDKKLEVNEILLTAFRAYNARICPWQFIQCSGCFVLEKSVLFCIFITENFIGRKVLHVWVESWNNQSSVAVLPSGFEFVLYFICLLELVGSFLGAIWLVGMFGSILGKVIPFFYLEVVACQEMQTIWYHEAIY